MIVAARRAGLSLSQRGSERAISHDRRVLKSDIFTAAGGSARLFDEQGAQRTMWSTSYCCREVWWFLGSAPQCDGERLWGSEKRLLLSGLPLPALFRESTARPDVSIDMGIPLRATTVTFAIVADSPTDAPVATVASSAPATAVATEEEVQNERRPRGRGNAACLRDGNAQNYHFFEGRRQRGGRRKPTAIDAGNRGGLVNCM